ncbi:DEAD/DEAH box helicase [Tessaracoccus coleopterorum]|uniref:hypothetical protein n=1 Tax=Tessaracoccus coleopterorum TaxID=2714950 RepID=UPI0018D43012|nr:hypothetical protein [Tessaracoccus coleopterorum]
MEDDSDERESRANRLTQEQSLILDVTRLLHRVEVRGGAGSGKTVLALTQARQLSQGRGDRKAQRVALLCYSIGLAAHFNAEVARWPYKERPAFVGTFEQLANQWGIESGSRQDPTFWEERLPPLMAEQAAELPPGKRFDAFVVDEAQDFAESWWRPLLAAMRDEEEEVCTSIPMRTSACSTGSAGRRSRLCRSCSTTTCATPGRLPRSSARSLPHGCGCRGRRARGRARALDPRRRDRRVR